MRQIIKIQIIITLLFPFLNKLEAQKVVIDSIKIENQTIKKQEYFYDSLKYKASQKKFTQIIYDILISPPKPYVDKKAIALYYYKQLEGKLISDIEIKSLDVFGPSFRDTSRKARSWIERSANNIHTKSNLNSIKKLLLFDVGDFVDPEQIYENERIIRSLPYIKDVQFLLKEDSIYSGLVHVTVLTQDRFSFGVSGGVEGSQAATLEVYNQNIFGVGHEISFRFLGHAKKTPYLGLETFYKIKNINGKFIDISLGYLNTYKSEGFAFIFDKSFITSSIKWAYGLHAARFFRTNKVIDDDIQVDSLYNFDYSNYSGWVGRSFPLSKINPNSTQMVLSTGFIRNNYFQRPLPDVNSEQYFTNSTIFLGGISFSQRQFVQDQLVFSYGITEDIPRGFKNEIVYGYEVNELGNRHYAHLFLSNGNLLMNKEGYLYISGEIGGYFKNSNYEEAQIKGTVNFISKQYNAGRKRLRFFTRVDYTLGLNRFEIENLNLQKDHHIRGFFSNEVTGKQRLSLNMEHVLFLRSEFYNFNMALFTFADLGIIGANNKLIFNQNYYSGIGMGLRLHNENLVFKTLQLRLAFYPFAPSDMSFTGFSFAEQSKRKFYSFEPTAPLPLHFR